MKQDKTQRWDKSRLARARKVGAYSVGLEAKVQFQGSSMTGPYNIAWTTGGSTSGNCGLAGSGRLAPPSTQLPCVSRLVPNCARAAPLREVRQRWDVNRHAPHRNCRNRMPRGTTSWSSAWEKGVHRLERAASLVPRGGGPGAPSSRRRAKTAP